MPITSDLFEAYLKCATKCFLRSLGETGTGNSYANWVKAEQLSYSSEGIKYLVKGVAEDECVTAAIDSKELRSPKWLAIQTIARTQNLESSIHAVERIISEEGGKSALLIPIRMVFTNKQSAQARRTFVGVRCACIIRNAGSRGRHGQGYPRK